MVKEGKKRKKKRGEGWRERRNEERIGHMKQVLEEKKVCVFLFSLNLKVRK